MTTDYEERLKGATPEGLYNGSIIMDRKTIESKLQKLREQYKKTPAKREILKRQARCYQIILDRTYLQQQIPS